MNHLISYLPHGQVTEVGLVTIHFILKLEAPTFFPLFVAPRKPHSLLVSHSYAISSLLYATFGEQTGVTKNGF